MNGTPSHRRPRSECHNVCIIQKQSIFAHVSVISGLRLPIYLHFLTSLLFCQFSFVHWMTFPSLLPRTPLFSIVFSLAKPLTTLFLLQLWHFFSSVDVDFPMTNGSVSSSSLTMITQPMTSMLSDKKRVCVLSVRSGGEIYPDRCYSIHVPCFKL